MVARRSTDFPCDVDRENTVETRHHMALPPYHTKSEYLRRLLFVLDMLVVVLVFLVVLRVVPNLWVDQSLDFTAHLGLLPIILASFGMSRLILESNRNLNRYTVKSQISYLLYELVIALGVTLALMFLMKLDFVSRLVMGSFAVSVTGTLIGVRLFIIWWYFVAHAEAQENFLNVVIVGSGSRAHVLASRLKTAFAWGVNVVGFLDPTGVSAGRRSSDTILGDVTDISKVLKDHVVEEVIIAVPRSLISDVQSIIDACQEEGVRLRFMADLYTFESTNVQLTMVENVPLLSFEFVTQEDNALIAKRFFDLVMTLAALPVLIPLFFIIALLIKLDSRGPVFFVQQRVGLHKRLIPLYKFRSMVIDAEERMKELEHLNEASGANFKIKDDPRITKFGRFIRKTSIDELPQLINVIKGDMSLVGPRPMSLRDVSLFDRGVQRKRFSVRPGITGLWQVSGRSNLSFDQWIELDLEYIDNWSFMTDLKILCKTLPAVLRGSGAV